MHVSMHACGAQINTLIVLPQALSTLTFIFKVFVCMHVHMCREAYVCAQVCGQRLGADIILDHYVPYLQRQSLSDPELTNSAGLVSQSPQEPLLLPLCVDYRQAVTSA